MLFQLGLVWTPISMWYRLVWLIPNSIMRNCSMCFAWCQSVSFILVVVRIKAVENESPNLHKQLKRIDLVLLLGLLISNLIFIVFICYLIYTSKLYSDSTITERINIFFDLELVCWITDSVSALTLIITALYSICKLRTV